MRALAVMAFALLSVSRAYSQVVVHSDTLMNETFEFGNPTAGKWRNQTQSDTTCKTTEWRTNAPDSLHDSRYAIYRSSDAKPSCTQYYYSPFWKVNLHSIRDTLFISLLVRRVDTKPAGDGLVVHFADAQEIVIASFEIPTYHKSAPATDTGWQKVTWAIPATVIKRSGDYEVFFSPKIAGDVDVLFDDVVVRLKWQKEQGMLVLDQPVPDTLPAGKKYIINWHQEGSTALTDEVKLEYSVNSGQTWKLLAVTDTPTNQYTWTVPHIAEDKVRLRITDRFDTAIRTVSNPFAIVWPVELLNPNGRGWVYAGLKVPITWKTDKSVKKLRISYTLDDGFHWSDLATNVSADTPAWVWTVPGTSTSKARIRINDMADDQLFDWSDTLFGIYNGLGIANTPPEGQSITCYPNPSSGKFTIRTPMMGPASLRITDLLGRTIYTSALPAGNTEHVIDLGQVKPGTYCVVVSEGNGVVRGMVVVE